MGSHKNPAAPPNRPPAPPLTLLAPDWHPLDTLLADPSLPPILWPVGNSSLVAEWLNHAVRLGCRKVILFCPDRPSAVRTALEGGAFWSLNLEIHPFAAPPETPGETLDHLPGREHPAFPDSPASLLKWWMAMNIEWLRGREAASVQIDSLREPGGWMGPRVSLSPGTRLIPPYWIGAGSFVGSGCTIGPDALIGPGCVLMEDVRVSRALILPGTFAGAHLELENKILRGASLFDVQRGARVDLVDDFIAAAVQRPADRPPMRDRIFAALLCLPAWLLSAGAGAAVRMEALLPGGKKLPLKTFPRGPLLARRARWLAAAAAGKLKLVGILPRASIPSRLPMETRSLLETTLPGVFSLADLHGAHDVESPDEIAHALYQAALPDSDREVRRALWRIALTSPPQ